MRESSSRKGPGVDNKAREREPQQNTAGKNFRSWARAFEAER